MKAKPNRRVPKVEKPSSVPDEAPGAPPLPVAVQPEDPTAFHRELSFNGPPRSGWERFQRFAHARKRTVYAVVLFGLAGTLYAALSPKRGADISGAVENYFARNRTAPRDWQYQVGPYTIGASELGERFRQMARYRLGPNAARQAAAGHGLKDFRRTEADIDLILLDARDKGIFQTAEARSILEQELRRVAADYAMYVQLRSRGFEARIEPNITRQQTKDFVKRNADYFRTKGLQGKNAEQAAWQMLTKQHHQRLSDELRTQRASFLQLLRETHGLKLRQPTNQR